MTELSLTETENYSFGVVAKGVLAVLADGRAGLRIIDVSDPASMVEVGSDSSTRRPIDLSTAGNVA